MCRRFRIAPALCDDPRQVAAQAEATLKSAAPASGAAFRTQLEQVAAVSALEEDEHVAELLPAVIQAAKGRRDDTAECLIETLRVHNDHDSGTLAQVEKNAAAAIERSQRAGQPWCEARLSQSRGDVYLNEGPLVTLAQCCRQVLRKPDVVGRLGGEEFLMVLPSTRQADAGALFERLRKVLQNIPVPGTRADQRLSCRVGSAELQPGASVKETLRRADESLYRAKPSGRNRLVLAETPDLATT